MKKRFREATECLTQKREKDFYAALSRAVFGYVGDRFNIPATGMTKEQLIEDLTKRGLAEELLSRLIFTVETCDAARFSPALVADVDAQKLLAETKELLSRV